MLDEQNPIKKVMMWYCKDCGEVTTDPDSRYIQYFHMNCPAK